MVGEDKNEAVIMRDYGKFAVVGLKYYGLYNLGRRLEIGEILRLVREPDNKYDPLAVAVEVQNQSGWTKVGFLPADVNSSIAHTMDTGASLIAKVDNYTHPGPRSGNGYIGIKIVNKVQADNLSPLALHPSPSIGSGNDLMITGGLKSLVDLINQGIICPAFWDMRNLDLRYAVFRSEGGIHPDFTGCNMEDTLLAHSLFSGAVMRFIRMPGRTLRSATFDSCFMAGLMAPRSDASFAHFLTCSISDARMRGVILEHARFIGCDLRRSFLQGANASTACFDNSNLLATNLLQANLPPDPGQAPISGCIFDNNEIWHQKAQADMPNLEKLKNQWIRMSHDSELMNSSEMAGYVISNEGIENESDVLAIRARDALPSGHPSRLALVLTASAFGDPFAERPLLLPEGDHLEHVISVLENPGSAQLLSLTARTSQEALRLESINHPAAFITAQSARRGVALLEALKPSLYPSSKI
jgi:uncharacterized protein YjbI with pentapeptide repeats